MAKADDKDKKKARESLLGSIVRKIKEGDRVIWIVLILLVMISIVAIFSSTSMMAKEFHTTRIAIFWKHLKFVVICLLLVVAINSIPNVKFFRVVSRYGFAASLFMLAVMLVGAKIGLDIKGIISVKAVNGAVRGITIHGFTLQVFEVVKVAMVMYLAWAVQAYGNNSFETTARLSERFPDTLAWLQSSTAQRWLYIFGPMLVVTAMVLPGSTGSAALIFIVCLITIMIGGMKWKQILGMLALSCAGAALALMLHVVSSGAIIPRLETAFNRMKIELPYLDKAKRAEQKAKISKRELDVDSLKVGTQEFRDYKDAVLQPMSAEIALVQGGRRFIGKGPGMSTQRYIVPVIYEDYMFSLLVEEYGLLMGLLVIIMYLSLFARGMIIVHTSSNRYAKACVGGLVFLITFQALFHILVNCNIGIVTGQTLPLISHGRCSFLCFSIAFGVILSISVLVNKKISAEQKKELEYMAMDDVKAGVSMVEDFEEQVNNQTIE